MLGLFKYILIPTFLLFLIVNISSCKKKINNSNSQTNKYTTASFTFHIENSNNAFQWDSIININAAGNPFSLKKLNLFISNFELKQNNGITFTSNDVFYIDPLISNKSTFTLDSLLDGTYSSISFLVGIDSIKNVAYGLSNSTDNINMIWPTAMGGGYHFLKMEGYFKDSNNVQQGYALHLGKNANLTKVTLNCTMLQNTTHSYNLTFNVSKVFNYPYVYDLNIDNCYTMSDPIAMNKIKTNLENVFTIKQNN